MQSAAKNTKGQERGGEREREGREGRERETGWRRTKRGEKGYMVYVDYYPISLLLGGAGIQLASLE